MRYNQVPIGMGRILNCYKYKLICLAEIDQVTDLANGFEVQNPALNTVDRQTTIFKVRVMIIETDAY